MDFSLPPNAKRDFRFLIEALLQFSRNDLDSGPLTARKGHHGRREIKGPRDYSVLRGIGRFDTRRREQQQRQKVVHERDAALEQLDRNKHR